MIPADNKAFTNSSRSPAGCSESEIGCPQDAFQFKKSHLAEPLKNEVNKGSLLLETLLRDCSGYRFLKLSRYEKLITFQESKPNGLMYSLTVLVESREAVLLVLCALCTSSTKVGVTCADNPWKRGSPLGGGGSLACQEK